MLAVIGFLVLILFNIWLTLMCVAMVFIPVNVGGRKLDFGVIVAFVLSYALCGFGWYYSLNSVTVSVV